MSPLFDIVIPCAGRTDDLLRLLASLHQHSESSLEQNVASITASDDRWSSSTAERLAAAFPLVRYVAGPARGPAANRNNGARQGQAPWLVFLDDDCYLKSDLVQAYAAGLQAAPHAQALEGAIHPVGERPNGNHHAPLNTSGGCMWSCNIAVSRATFEALRGFDETFPFAAMEDCDLHERLKQRDKAIPFLREAVVCHPWRSISEREVTRQIISHALYAVRHPPFISVWSLRHVARNLVGRARLYRRYRSLPIPRTKLPTVAYDLAAPLLLWAVVRFRPLRMALWRHFAQVRQA